jgi:LL-diaminopimelate aminotransferase
MRTSLLPVAPENMFQRAKKNMKAAAQRGINLIDLSVGEPEGPALLPARQAAAKAIMSDERAMHRYQDNDCHPCPDFAKRFVQAHLSLDLGTYTDLAYLPAPGTKPMLHIFVDALGAWSRERPSTVLTMTYPGYGTPAFQARIAKNVIQKDLPMSAKTGFFFRVEDLPAGLGAGDMIMINIPHNPTGIIATREELFRLCEYCSRNSVRLVNDNAYGVLAYDDQFFSLTEVAVEFPDLSWIEIFSASKAGNNTGWRVAAMVGSPDFIGDVSRMKGEDDSGGVAAMMIGMLELYENHMPLIDEVNERYRTRVNFLIGILTTHGMKLAALPRGGFFVLCECPKRAFGQEIRSPEDFNNLMIDNTGVAGIPFAPNWIRYAVCATDVIGQGERIDEAFHKAEVSYAAEAIAA